MNTGSGTVTSTTFCRGTPLILAVIALLVGGLGLVVTFGFINGGVLGRFTLLQISRASNGNNINQTATEDLTRSFKCSDLGLPSNQTVVDRQQYHVKEDYKQSINIIKFKDRSSSTNAACQSKYQQHCYRKNSGPGFFPPPLFLYELRSYEDYHARCTAGVNLTLAATADQDHRHQAGNDSAAAGAPPAGCRYLVWKGMDGMGNHIVSLVSAFVYALLTRRALLVATDTGVNELFCNPFPRSTWVLPPEFLEASLRSGATRLFAYLDDAFRRNHAGDGEGIFRPCDVNLTAEYSLAPARVQVYLTCCDGELDHQFFCPTAQRLLAGVPWIFFHGHEYSVPGLYLLPDFRQRLDDWFPERDVFMHAARYLLNPENGLWGRITELYRTSHMAEAPSTVGIHVRAWKGEYEAAVDRQVLRCAKEQRLLPDDGHVGLGAAAGPGEDEKEVSRRVVVVLASQRGEYAQNLSREYMKDGGVYVWAPSAEGRQKAVGEDLGHDQKAVADMWLLSFARELVITPFSTFGGCASGMAGVVPLVFTYFGGDKLDFPACLRTNLAGPCFIKHPRHQPCDLDPPTSSIFDPLSMLPDTIANCHLNFGLSVLHPKSQ